MKAIIQAGGMGTRMRPLTLEIPKPLLPVKKKPIVNHLIELFHRHGIKEIAILASRAHEEDFLRWRKAWRDELPTEVTIFFEDSPRGTFGGFEALREWINGDSFFVTNADDLKEVDLHEMIAFHKKHGPLGTLSLMEIENPEDYGVTVLDGHKVISFVEKSKNPPSKLISIGLYLLDPEVLNHADFSRQSISIEYDIFPELVRKGKLAGYVAINGRWSDCGTMERWEKTIKEW